MNGLRIFSYSAKQIRTVMRNDEPWFVLKDVCGILSLYDVSKVADRLDEDETMFLEAPRLIPDVSFDDFRGNPIRIINEPGLYNVILRSDKPEAKEFKRWVTHEVLPAIRKTGVYRINTDDTELINAATRYLGTIIRVMHNQKSPAEKIAKEAEMVCQQYNLPLIPDFIEQSACEQLTLAIGIVK
jgi:prophage antirepressor-like protein